MVDFFDYDQKRLFFGLVPQIATLANVNSVVEFRDVRLLSSPISLKYSRTHLPLLPKTAALPAFHGGVVSGGAFTESLRAEGR